MGASAFDERAGTYAAAGWHLLATEALLSCVPPDQGESWWDLCCGTGNTLKALADSLRWPRRITCVDNSAEMLQQAGVVENKCRTEFVMADVQRFVSRPAGIDSPDVIFCSLGLHYLEAAPFAAALRCHTAQGSRLAFSVPHDAQTPLTQAFGEAWLLHVGSPLPIQRWGSEHLLAWMSSAGSTGVAIQTVECAMSNLTMSEAWAAVYPMRADLLAKLPEAVVGKIQATFERLVDYAQSQAPQFVTVHLGWSRAA